MFRIFHIVFFLTISFSSSGFEKRLIDISNSNSFNNIVVHSGEVEKVFDDGEHKIKISALKNHAARFSLFLPNEHKNLKDFVNISIGFENPSTHQSFCRLLIKDHRTENDSWYRPNLSHNAWINPNETRVFDALLVRHKYVNKENLPSYIDYFPKMHGLPHAQMLVWFGVDVSNIQEIVFELQPKQVDQTLFINSIYATRRASPQLLEKNPKEFFPFIDRYGQYMHQEWPGKISDDNDLIRMRIAEESDLKRHPKPPYFNKFGGWVSGPTYLATGHFRVEKINNKWWFVDPNGKLFWSFGSTGIGYQESRIALTEKRHFYKDMPSLDDPIFGKFYRRGGESYKMGDDILYKKYGEDYLDKYKIRSLERAHSWGLNTCGGWSRAANNQPKDIRMPFTKELWVNGRKLAPIYKLVDPFEEDFSLWVENAVKATGDMIDDPYCIGYFCNNEIHWGKNPIDVVKAIHNCDLSVASKKELDKFLLQKNINISNASEEDLTLFYVHLLETYYKKCRDAIKKIAPNKLYLGSRLHDGALRKEAFSAAAKYCDVVSVNVYEKDVKEFNVRDERDKPFFTEDVPFLVGEFDFGALDRGKFFTGIGFAADQRNRGECLKYFIQSALENTRCVGAHWFHYMDSPTGSRHFDNENANCGLVATSDTPYVELISAFRETSRFIYPYRFNKE